MRCDGARGRIFGCGPQCVVGLQPGCSRIAVGGAEAAEGWLEAGREHGDATRRNPVSRLERNRGFMLALSHLEC